MASFDKWLLEVFRGQFLEGSKEVSKVSFKCDNCAWPDSTSGCLYPSEKSLVAKPQVVFRENNAERVQDF